MPTIVDNAICIRRWEFSETSQTVSLFTRVHGVIRGLAKGARREKGAFSGGFDPLTQGQIVAIVKPGGELATLTEWTLQETCRHIRQSLEANRAALYMADLVHHMVTDHDPHEALFDDFVLAIDALREPEKREIALLRFQWRLLEETGYRPQLDQDVETGRVVTDETQTLAFSARAGGLVEDTGASDRWRVRRETIEALKSIAAGETSQSPPVEVLARGNRLLAAYLREMMGTEPATMRWRFGVLGVPGGDSQVR